MPDTTTDDQSGKDTNTETGTQQQQQPDSGTQQQESTSTSSTGQQQSTEEDPKDYRKLYEQTLEQSRKWETRAKGNADKAKKWDEAEEANRTEAEKHSHRADAAEARAKQAMTAAVNAEIKAAAHGWANPDDAPRFLDEKDRYITDDGELDTQAIAEDVAAVLKNRPHLAVAEKRDGSNPDPGQGARGGLTVADQIRDAESKGDTREALRLKSQQLLSDRKGGS